ncbi:hypothetical protein GPL06_13370 [Bacteroides salyersiae]|uniref:hypothetical protein n=1 Tax=Bacteroides salyersiae TaxID=291644 RepID=UPI001C025CD3|nr:hypothetical protein [Bacteroides salyersiae]MBT9873784.1 hypothetical protein [Bacteroides salyersiae]
MRKIIEHYLAFVLLFLFSACGEDEDIKEYYTEEQKAALNVFHGKFQAEDYDRAIEFLEVYDTPKEIPVSTFFESSYNEKMFGKMKTSWASSEDTYYFSLSRDAFYMYTYKIYDNGNIGGRDKTPLIIINENEFNLYPLTIVNPERYKRIE